MVLQSESEAARFNAKVLHKLQNAFVANPDVDLLALFPTEYSMRLSGKKKPRTGNSALLESKLLEQTSEDNVVTAVSTNGATAEPPTIKHSTSESESSLSTVTVAFPLSESVQNLLGVQTQDTSNVSLSVKLRNTVDSSEIIWRSTACDGHLVVRCRADIVAKIVPNIDDYTEYTSMQYLAQQAPDIPVPKPLGFVILNGTSYIFMSYIPGLTVDKIWPKLCREQKISLSSQLNQILLKLRALKVPNPVFLGGIGGEGCKDTRRHTRICQEPITTCEAFKGFQFSNPHFGSSVYISFLRGLAYREAKIVFSHGDFRAENIVVQSDRHGEYWISGVLDWEKSGFYPDYFECTKATNNLCPSDDDDWYLYLPPCASPSKYPRAWMVDRLWDPHVA